MMPRKIFTILPFFSVLLYSCSSTKTESNAVDSSTSKAQEGATIKSIYDSGYDGGYKMVKDEETGFMRAVSEKETSPFENKVNQFRGENSQSNKKFTTSQYDAKRWQDAEKKKSWLPWKDSTKEFQHSPHFIKKNSSLAKRSPQEKGKSYETSAIKRSGAREETAKRMEKLPSYVIEKATNNYKQPPIISNQDYNSSNKSNRSVEDVKGLLE